MVLNTFGKYLLDVDEYNNVKSLMDTITKKIIIKEGEWKVAYNNKRLSLYKEYKWCDEEGYYHTSINPPNGKGESIEIEYD